ncbi:MAG: DUF4097 family beta strand repeat protein [Gemmatimonadaceae bacterium]|nr:DUF4097 family beta strand repeat protein [Gemmatimonadaceae bacterium]
MQIRFVPAALSALVATVPFAAALAQSAGSTERERVTGSTVAIYNLAGNVRVESGSGSDVTVDVTRGGRDARDLRVVTADIRGRNTLVVQYPDDDIVYSNAARGRRSGTYRNDMRINGDGTWGGESRNGRKMRIKSSGDGSEAWADLVIRVPAGKTVAVYLAVGELTSANVDGDIRLDVNSATVSARGHRGTLNIDAGSGGVTVSDARVRNLSIDVGSGGVSLDDVQSEKCVIDTGSGSVRGRMARCGTLSIDVGSGGVTLDQVRSDNTLIDSGSGSVRLDLETAPSSLTIDTGSGSVALTLPATLSADVNVETGSGGITSDFPVRTSRVDRNSLRGTIGAGASKIRVETGSGSITLRKASL